MRLFGSVERKSIPECKFNNINDTEKYSRDNFFY